MEDKSKTTEELLTLLKDTSSLEAFYHSSEDYIPSMTTSDYLKLLINEHNLSIKDIISYCSLGRAFGYQIFSGKRNPRRNVLLGIALTMGLSLEETQRLLKIAQRGELYVKNRRDSAIMYCLIHKISLVDTDILLEHIGEALLGEKD